MDAHSGVLEPSPNVPLTDKVKRKLALQMSKSVAKEESQKKAKLEKATAATLKFKAREEKKKGK